jgi:hypothetical protein
VHAAAGAAAAHIPRLKVADWYSTSAKIIVGIYWPTAPAAAAADITLVENWLTHVFLFASNNCTLVTLFQ